MKRTTSMTDRERVEALLNRKKPDRIPIWPMAKEGFATVYAKASIVEAYNNPEVCYAAQRKACILAGYLPHNWVTLLLVAGNLVEISNGQAVNLPKHQ